jgi:ribonuclease HI
MTDLKQLSEAATGGVWGQYHGSNGPWQDQANKGKYTDWDSSHCMSAMNERGRYPIGQFKHADTAAFVEALVNAYRAGELIPASEARAREAVAYEVAADAVLHKSDEMLATNRTWVDDRPYVCEENVYRRIKDLAPDHTTTALEQIKADADKAGFERGMKRAAEICMEENERRLALASIRVPAMASEIRDAILATLSADTQENSDG